MKNQDTANPAPLTDADVTFSPDEPLSPDALATLWARVLGLKNTAPYCYASPYYQHKDAARTVAENVAELSGVALKSWWTYVNNRISGMSNYAGD